jgi:hypothetical protein
MRVPARGTVIPDVTQETGVKLSVWRFALNEGGMVLACV